MVGLQDVVDAQQRLTEIALRTAVAEAGIGGARVFCKCENRQVTGSFKIRGAYNCSSRFAPEQIEAGLVAISSGNHAQAVAKSAQLLGTTALIAMPEDTSRFKLEATKRLGAEVMLFDRFARDRDDVMRELVASSKRAFVPPYDHPHVIAGQGTATLELLDEVGDLDVLVVQVSGGGLIAGNGLVAKARNPSVRLVGVEPSAADDTKRSLAEGQRVRIDAPETIADGLRAEIPGAVTFEINRRQIDEIVTVTDAEIRDAMTWLRDEVGESVEPSGAVGIAALLSERVRAPGQRVGVILSGGNVDQLATSP